jgi:hypothetical protein
MILKRAVHPSSGIIGIIELDHGNESIVLYVAGVLIVL